MSIAGGLSLALDRGHAIRCGAVQIFLKNQRQWAARPLGAEDVRAFHAARKRPRIRASPRPNSSSRSRAATARRKRSPQPIVIRK